MVNLTSTYMGKTINHYDHMVKFTLLFSDRLSELKKQVTMGFKELENRTFLFGMKTPTITVI